MSDKDRAKKNHERKDKKSGARREGENLRTKTAAPKHQAKDESNLTDTQVPAKSTSKSRDK